MTKRINNYLLALLKLAVASLALYFVFSKVPWHIVSHHLVQADKSLLLCALLLQWASMSFTSLRSKLYLACYGLKLSYLQAASIYYIGAMFNIILPGGIGGDGYKIMLLSKYHNLSKLKALRVMLYERANGLYGLSVLCLIILPYTLFYTINPLAKYIIIFCLIMVAPCYFLGAKYILRDDIKIAFKISPLSLVIQILQVASMVCIIYAINSNIPYLEMKSYIALFLIASITSTIPISIGGAGLRELTFLYGTQLIGYSDPSYGVAIAVIIFLLTVVSSMLGLPIWLYYSNVTYIKK